MPKNVVGRADHASPTPKGTLMDKIRKFIVSALGVLAMVVTTGVLEENVEIWVNAILAVATAAGVYAVPNRTAPPAPPLP